MSTKHSMRPPALCTGQGAIPLGAGVLGGWGQLGMPYIDFPSQRPLTGDFLQKAVGDWSQMLQGLAEVPVYFDLSSPEKLARLMEDACKALPSELDKGIACLHRWAEGKARRCYESQPV